MRHGGRERERGRLRNRVVLPGWWHKHEYREREREREKDRKRAPWSLPYYRRQLKKGIKETETEKERWRESKRETERERELCLSLWYTPEALIPSP